MGPSEELWPLAALPLVPESARVFDPDQLRLKTTTTLARVVRRRR